MKENTITTFRRQLGLSQTNMALYLSISVSLLKMVETNKRELPSAAFIKFNYLQSLVQYNGTQLPDNIDEPQTRALSQMIQYYEEILPKLQRKLDIVKTHHQQIVHLSRLLHELKKQQQPIKSSKNDSLWQEMMAAHTAIQLRKYGVEEQLMLQLKIDTCIYTLQRAKQLQSAE